MPDYQQGKIYRIRGGDECYIGSTVEKYISNRFGNHKKNYKLAKSGRIKYSCRSFLLFDKYGVENCIIELIELYPCGSKAELHRREGEYIRTETCVNKQISGRTVKEWVDDNKVHHIQQQKEYREKNKETRKIKRSKRYNCECGVEISWENRARHLRSNRHTSSTKKETND